MAVRGLSVHGPVIAVPSLVVEHGLEGSQASVVVVCGFHSCYSRTLEHGLSSCGFVAL